MTPLGRVKRGFPFRKMADSLWLWWEGFVHVIVDGEGISIFSVVIRHVEEM